MTDQISFIIGAGFSKWISPRMPLQKDLADNIPLDLANKIRAEKLDALTSEYSFEQLVSYLFTPYPWKLPAENLRQRSLYWELLEYINNTVVESEGVSLSALNSPDIRSIGLYWSRTKSNIITFNYDNLIERILSGIHLVGRWYDYWDLPVANVLDRSDIDQGAFLDGGEDKLTNPPVITKLHGSISWFRSLDFPQSNEIIYFSQPGTKNKKTITNLQGLTPFIVPPTLEKSHFLQHELLSIIWRRARCQISQAKQLAIIGYSLPVADTYVRLLLAASLQPKTKVTIINSSVDITFKQKCLDYFMPYDVQLDTTYLGGEDSINRFINKELIFHDKEE